MGDVSPEISEPRWINGVTILGPGLFGHDAHSIPISPIASAFPAYRALVTTRGIHATHAAVLLEFLKRMHRIPDSSDLQAEETKLFEDAVSLVVRESVVLIRSDPDKMDRVFAADEMLQQLLPKERIQFTLGHRAEIRKRLRQRGESWRISPAPRSVEEIRRYIRSSMVRVNTGTVLYQNASSGERFLTYQEFMRIRPLLRQDKSEALARLKEISELSRLLNEQGVHELSFFLPSGKNLDRQAMDSLIASLQGSAFDRNEAEALDLFDRFLALFAKTAGTELTVDTAAHPVWRTTMFCRLYSIHEAELEELTLGLSPEFHLNVFWLPGILTTGGGLHFGPEAGYRLRSLVAHFWQTWPRIESINVGRVESSQTERDRSGEEREVYLVVLGLADDREEIRIVRRMKWDVLHRLKRGTPLDQAISETLQYGQYIRDRLRAFGELGIQCPIYGEIRFQEEIPGLGVVPMFFFERCYLPGIVTDKIPLSHYAREGFVIRLGELLGRAAAVSLVMGRACPRSGHVFFDDGDEVIQCDGGGLPERLLLGETTGSFTDWCSPIVSLLPHCLTHLAAHLERARQKGIDGQSLEESIAAFSHGLAEEVSRMQQRLSGRSPSLWSLFADRGLESGGIRCRWEAVLRRLQATDIGDLQSVVAQSPFLAPFM